ncbi:MAG: hypothetical protein AB7U82_17825 [Blastocatellales bacterium]
MAVESRSPLLFLSPASNRRVILSLFALIFCLLAAAPEIFAQREYTVVKPRARSASDPVTVPRRASQATKGLLVVLLDPEVAGKVVITDTRGRVLEEGEADASGQAVFELRRGLSYLVKASFPGYVSAQAKSTALRASASVRLTLKAQFAKLEIPGLPTGAQVLIDNQLRATASQSLVVLDNLEPGAHSLLVRHPEYNDYSVNLGNLEAGSEVRFFPLNTILVKVAKLTIQGPAGATVLIDGAVQGKIRPDGAVQIDYELNQASERTISVELLGHQTWTKLELLSPGPRTITATLDPIATSAGVSDFFDNLSLWKAPPSWKIISDARNKKLEVKGEQLGLLGDKVYRDFDANFLLWLNDGKGATWAMRASKDGRSYYLFHLAGSKSTTHTPKKFYTYLVRDGAAPIEVSTPVPVLINLDQRGPFTVTVSVRGYTITQSITDTAADESDLGKWTDTTATKDKFLYGSVGFRALSGEIFQVDDLNLEPLNPEPAKQQ